MAVPGTDKALLGSSILELLSSEENTPKFKTKISAGFSDLLNGKSSSSKMRLNELNATTNSIALYSLEDEIEESPEKKILRQVKREFFGYQKGDEVIHGIRERLIWIVHASATDCDKKEKKNIVQWFSSNSATLNQLYETWARKSEQCRIIKNMESPSNKIAVQGMSKSEMEARYDKYSQYINLWLNAKEYLRSLGYGD